MPKPLHRITITANAAGCSCRLWIAEQRRDDETQGAFTTRAYGLHLAHVARQDAPTVTEPMFGDAESTSENETIGGLF